MNTKPPYFDPVALRHELTGLFQSAGGHAEARPAVVARLKQLVQEGRQAARERRRALRTGAPAAPGHL